MCGDQPTEILKNDPHQSDSATGDQPTEILQNDPHPSDSATSVNGDNQQPVSHLSVAIDQTTLLEKDTSSQQIKKKLSNSSATTGNSTDKTQDKRGLSSEQQGEHAIVWPKEHEHTGLANRESVGFRSSKETENDCAIREEIVSNHHRTNVSHHYSVSTDFREKIKRLKYDSNSRSNVMETSVKQQNFFGQQEFKGRNQTAHTEKLKPNCTRAAYSVRSSLSSAYFKNNSYSSCSFTSPNPITLRGLHSRKRYSKYTSEIYPDQPDEGAMPLKNRKKILLCRKSSDSHSSVSKLREKQNVTSSVLSSNRNSSSSECSQESNQLKFHLTSELPVDKSKDTVEVPHLITATTDCSMNKGKGTTCESSSRLSSITQNFTTNTSAFAAASCEQDGSHGSFTESTTLCSVCLGVCYKSDPSAGCISTSLPNVEEENQFSETTLVSTRSGGCVATSNTSVQSVKVIPNAKAIAANRSCVREVPVSPPSEDNNFNCIGKSYTSNCIDSCGESAVNVKAGAECSGLNPSKSPVGCQSGSVARLLDRETECFGGQLLCREESREHTSGTINDMAKGHKPAVSLAAMSSNQNPRGDSRNMETVTMHNSSNREMEWKHTFDATHGRRIYVNLRTGNCSFDPPVETGGKPDAIKEDPGYNGDDHEMDGFKRLLHPQVPHLSFNCTPWLPRADRHKASGNITDTSTGELDMRQSKARFFARMLPKCRIENL